MTPDKSQKLSTYHISTTEEFEKLKNIWGELLAQNHVQSAFMAWEWLFSWWKIYNETCQLWIVTTWKGEELLGILPLGLYNEKKRSIHFRTLRPLGCPQIDVSGVLVKDQNEDVLESLCQYLVDRHTDWDILELKYYRQDDPALVFFKSSLRQKGLSFREKTNNHFHISLEGSWAEYRPKLSRKFRKNLRRAARHAHESGEVAFEHFSGANITWQVFEKIIKVNQYTHYPLLFNSSREQAFHKELTKHTHTKEILTVFLLSIDKIPLAYEYGFIYKDRYESWRAGYDTRSDPIMSLGKLLSQMAIEQAFDLNYKEIDFLRGDEAYKEEWKPFTRKYSKVQFIRKTNFVACFVFIWLPRIKAFVKDLIPERFIKRR